MRTFIILALLGIVSCAPIPKEVTECITIDDQLEILDAEEKINTYMIYKGDKAKEYVFQQTGQLVDVDSVLFVQSISGRMFTGLIKDGCLFSYFSPVAVGIEI